MKIDVLDIDKAIQVNNLERVTSPWLFSNKMVYDPQGILSSDIFGVSRVDRRTTFAYINLSQTVMHPHIYHNVMRSMFKNITYLVSGLKRYSVKDGVLVQDDEDGWTGIQALYDHWNEIKWEKSSSANTANKRLLATLNRNQVFVNKILVCPPAYRDVTLSGTIDKSDYVNELNNLYVKIIRIAAQLEEGGIFKKMQYLTQAKLQDTLVEIYDYFKDQISRKNGLIKKNLIGKSIDYGVRSVISAPTYSHNRVEDSMVDIEHTAVPISQCCSLFYPFISAWLRSFFTREIINDPNIISFYDEENKREISATLKDIDTQFSEKNINKMINDYCRNPDNRFKKIQVDVLVPVSPRENRTLRATILMKGKTILENSIPKELKRPLTITDLLYLASVDVCEHKRHVMVSRYPVGTDKGVYFNKIRVQSTIKHITCIFNGEEYKFYPYIDFNCPTDQVGAQFIDTLVMSNSHLDGMGADYDGDQCSARGIYTDEANAECEKIMQSKISALTITGSNAKAVSKELVNSMYELTKTAPNARSISSNDQKELLELSSHSITRDWLASAFADTVNISGGKGFVKKRKSRFNTWDIISVPEDYFFKSSDGKNMTVGRFIFNKFVLEKSGIIATTGIIDMLLDKDGIGNIDNMVGDLLLNDKITREQFNRYTDYRDSLGYWLNGMLAHTISAKMLRPLDEIETKKKELYERYKDDLNNGNINVMVKVSDELVEYAKELLKDDPGMDLYLSGDLDFANNYKNNCILKGAVKNNITDEFDFIGTSYLNGIEIKDIPAHANSILAGQFPASIATKDAGYIGKKLLALLQMMEVDEPGSDCHTKNLIPIKVTNTNMKFLYYTYILVDGQLQLLTKDNIKSYLNQTVMMRSPMSCRTDKICSKCAGELFYKLDTRYAGLFAIQLSHSDLNLALKAKHNSLVSLYTINVNDDLLIDV